MEFGPITGIRSVSLLNVPRAEKDSPRLEVDPSASTGDEPYSSSQQPPEREAEEEAEALIQAVPEQEEKEEADEERPEGTSKGQRDWFV